MPVEPLAPGLLLAAPTMVDTFFEHAVILLLESGEDGAMGFIVNRPMEMTLGQLGGAMDLRVHESYTHAHVYGGGPVKPELGWILARRNEHTPEGLEIAMELDEDIVLVTAVDSLRRLLETPHQEFRLVLGYSGWGSGQLEDELRDGSWLPHGYAPSALFSDESLELWKELLADQGLGDGLLWGKPVSES